MLDPEQALPTTPAFGGGKITNGRACLNPNNGTVSTRKPDILYLVPGIMAATFGDVIATQQTSQALTDTVNRGLLIDYAPSHTGEWIAYSIENEEGGCDLRLVNRNGTAHATAAFLWPDYCSQPGLGPRMESGSLIPRKTI